MVFQIVAGNSYDKTDCKCEDIVIAIMSYTAVRLCTKKIYTAVRCAVLEMVFGQVLVL